VILRSLWSTLVGLKQIDARLTTTRMRTPPVSFVVDTGTWAGP